MTDQNQKQLGKILWNIADQLRGAMDADDFRDYMLSFLFLRYLSENYVAATQRELGADYPKLEDDDHNVPLSLWYANNADDVAEFEKQMRRKVHYVIKPKYLWTSIANIRAGRTGNCSTPCKRASNTSRTTPFKAPSKGCSPRLIWPPISWAGPMPTVTPSSVPSSRRSPKGWRSFPQTSMPSAMPTNT